MSGGDPIRVAVRPAILVLCAAALILIVMIAADSELDETSGKALGTAVALASFSLTGVAGTTLARRRPDIGLFGYLTALVSLAGMVLVVGAIWEWGDGDWNAAGVAIVLALAGAHASVLLGSARDEDADVVRLVRAGTLLAIALLSLMAVVDIAASSSEEVNPRAAGIVAVLYLLGALLLPLLRRTSPTRKQTPGDPAVELLREHGHLLVDGPASRVGTHGPGRSTSLRAPDGRLVELIVYDSPPGDG